MRRPTYDLTQPGWAIAIAVALLLTVGIASIYVTDTHYVRGHDGPRNALKQCAFVLCGLMVAAAVLKIGYASISRHAYVVFFVLLIALVPLLVARVASSTFGGIIKPRNGAYRWINLPGFQLQPSEFMKVAYLISLAWYLRYRKNYRRLGGLLVPLAVSMLPLSLILFEPDLGTALLLLSVMFTMLFAAGARLRHLALIVLLGAVVAPVAWGRLREYQRLRITAVLLQSDTLRQAVIEHPESFEALASKRQAVEWAASSGYQLVHSKNAVGSGAITGCGWGNGVYVTSGLLPDRHNDFIFSVIAHQWGFLACIMVVGCYTVIVLSGARIASATIEPCGRLLAVGVVALIVTQAAINIGMAVGLMPITGMTLPFVSYGGSSLLSDFIATALLISVSQHRPFLLAVRPFEFTREHAEKLHVPVPPASGSEAAESESSECCGARLPG
ncbi:MAG: FtsW/RodA/SpoVE family cell cycle protein [Phycisphaerae bacterium]